MRNSYNRINVKKRSNLNSLKSSLGKSSDEFKKIEER